MTPTNDSATILLISNNSPVIEATRKTFAKESAVRLIDHPTTFRNLYQVIAEAQPVLVLLDFKTEDQPFYLLYKLTSEFPRFPVIAILPESKMNRAARTLQLGARAFIEFPFSSQALLTTINNAVGMVGTKDVAASPELFSDLSQKGNQTFTIFSPKGGAGCTTIAVNLALTLSKSLKEEVLLIDGKQLFGHVALYLNLLSGNSIFDLINHADMLDKQLISQVVVRHKSGLLVLPGITSITDSQMVDPESLYRVIHSLQQIYPNIIIDAGNHLDENIVTYMDSASKILLVLNPDIAAMRDVRQFIEITEALAYPKDKTLFLLNSAGRKADVERAEIENILQVELLGTIPADEELALSSMNEGIPIIQKKPRHPISRAYRALAKKLITLIDFPEDE